MKVAIYCRISRDDEGDEAGVKRQEEDCRAYAKERGWDLVDIYVDNDISAMGGKHRPEYKRFMKALVAREFDAVVTWHQDRITRNPWEMEEYIEACIKRRGQSAVTTYSLNGGPLTLSTPESLLTARIGVVIAQYYVEHNTTNILRAKQSAREKGEFANGLCPKYGYRMIAKKKIEVIPEHAPYIREMHKKFQSGWSFADIARWMTNEGQDVYKHPYTGERIRSMLRNATYAALIEHMPEGRKHGIGDGRRIGKIYQGEWEPIVTREVWETSRDLIIDKTRPITRPGRRTLLTTFLKCGKCGINMTTQAERDDGTTPGYRCINGHITIRQHLADEFVVSKVLEIIRTSEDVRDVSKLKAELKRVAQKLTALSEACGRDDITVEELTTASRGLRDRQHAIKARLLVTDVTEATGTQAWWDGLGLDMQRSIIGGTVQVTVYPAKDVGPALDDRIKVIAVQ